ncbi:hypothetical protein [Paenibacillus sp. LPE1-1-1.1]|uniref:hypothetical protein n=1 Tax=Paenibacillus sp. LPE1-1-1.1 TaxID=3135230 RepID=UPI00343708EE
MHLELEEGTWTLFITCITIIFLLNAYALIRMSIIHKTKAFVWLIFSTIFQTGALVFGQTLFPQDKELGIMLSE